MEGHAHSSIDCGPEGRWKTWALRDAMDALSGVSFLNLDLDPTAFRNDPDLIFLHHGPEDGRVRLAATEALAEVGDGSGTVYGIKAHAAFNRCIKRWNSPDLRGEISYLKGSEVKYGTKGSIRLDAVFGAKGQPRIIWDLKTGSAKLTDARIAQIRANLPKGYRNIPIRQVGP